MSTDGESYKLLIKTTIREYPKYKLCKGKGMNYYRRLIAKTEEVEAK